MPPGVTKIQRTTRSSRSTSTRHASRTGEPSWTKSTAPARLPRSSAMADPCLFQDLTGVQREQVGTRPVGDQRRGSSTGEHPYRTNRGSLTLHRHQPVGWLAAWIVDQLRLAGNSATPRPELRVVFVGSGLAFAASRCTSYVSVNQLRPTDQACRT
jgi:hypothetical protein